MFIHIEKPDANGDFGTLLNRWGKRIKWRGRVFTIPRYFKTDFASVPRFFWRVLFYPTHPKAVRAAVAHDYIYRVHPEGWTRKEADLMFYDLLVEDNMPKFVAWMAYKGVRLFGGYSWNKSYARYREGKENAQCK